MRCIVPSCSNDSGRTSAQDISYFTIPDEPALRAAWLAIGLKPRWRGAVCSRHFQCEDLLHSGGRLTLRPGAVPVTQALVCRMCLGTDRKLYSMVEYNSLCTSYETLTGFKMCSEESLPRFLCAECARQLLAGARFRTRGLRAHSVLLEVAAKHRWITVENIIKYQSLLTPNPTYSQADQRDFDIELIKTEKAHTNEETDTSKELRFETGNNDVMNQLILKYEISDDVSMPYGEIEDRSSGYNLVGEVRVKDELDDSGTPKGEETSDADSKKRQIQEVDVPTDVRLEKNDDEDTLAGKDDSSEDNDPFREERQYDELTSEAPNDTEVTDARQKQETEGTSNKDSSCDKSHYQTSLNLSSKSKTYPNQLYNEYKFNYKTFKKQSRVGKILFNRKTYSCHICSKSLSTKAVLQMHLRIHSGERPYSCDVCSKTFTQSSTLRRHISSHAGNKPYSCDICNKSLTTKSILRRHLRIHSGEKPYSCDVCSKSFGTSSHLRRHLPIHSREKLYSC